LGDPIIPTIQDTIVITDWLTIGPFSSGVREPGISYLPDSENFTPYEGLQHRDILTQSGELTWHRTKSENDKVKVKGDSVNWDFIQDLYGNAGVNGVSYAYAEFENRGEKRALVIAEGASFRLNGKGFVGDPYSAGYVRIPVLLKDGKNRILVSVGGAGEQEFTFKIIPAPSSVTGIYRDATVPDIIYNEDLNSWVAIPVLNTTQNPIDNAKIIIGNNKLINLAETNPGRIGPLCGKKVPVPLKITQAIKESIPGDTILVPIKIIYENYIDSGYIKLRLRKPSQTRKETFISAIDSSVQYYAVLPPVNFDPQKDYSLILTLHGASVEASGLPDCYTQKDWAYVVAPTNRRPFGFDWQDWGRLDALEVLEIVRKKYPIAENRIYLAGHSMGGHGTWHIGLTHSDLFAAIVPSAGWTSHQIYVPWSLQKSLFFGQPDQLAIRDKVLREDNPLVFLENARNLPIYILQGGADDNVPPIHARLFTKYLEADAKFRNADYIYKEVPGMGHWWDNDTFPGAECVDNPALMEFLKNHTRNPYPKHIHFKTTDLSQNNHHYWLTIDQLDKLYEDAVIYAKVDGSTITIQTENIRQFTLDLNENIVPPLLYPPPTAGGGMVGGKVRLIINNQEIKYDIHSMPYALSLTQDVKGFWRIVSGVKPNMSGIKHNNSYGPIKQAYYSPFVLVYGTKGDSAMTELLLHQARIQALTWWIRANGRVDIVPDTEVTQAMIDKYNLILFGNAQTNAVTARIQNKLPIRIPDGQAQLNISAIKRLYGDLGIIFLYPNPLNPKKFVLLYEGTTEMGQKLSDRFGTLYSGAGLPDFLILGEEVKQKGWGGVKAAGFFSNQWQLESDLLYLGSE
jgi:pimeloyl-ACP methyl ester carboxylesterase